MADSENDFVKPQIRITKYAYESLLTEMSKRKLPNLSSLLESIAIRLEQARGVGGKKKC